MSAIFDRYPNGGGEMLLALSLADHAHDNGTHIYPSVKSLAQKTRQSIRAVQYQLRGMLNAGWLILTNQGDGGRGQHNEYCISPEWLKGADFAPVKTMSEIAPVGAKLDIKGCNPLHPPYNPKESSVNHPVRAARLPATWTLPAPDANWTRAEFPAWSDEHIKRIATMFKNHWLAAGGQAARKVDWSATWRNWCLKEPAIPAGARQVPGAPAPAWYESESGIKTRGHDIGIKQQPGERIGDYRWRIEDHLRDSVLGNAPDIPIALRAAPATAPKHALSDDAMAIHRAAMRAALTAKVLPPQQETP